jgi:hypothetical protein
MLGSGLKFGRIEAKEINVMQKQRQMYLLVLLFLSFSAIGYGQFSSNLQGLVQDPTGAAVPHATVRLRNIETRVALTATTTETGFYRFNSLPPGRYEVTGEATGFRPSKVEVVLQTAQTADVTLPLTVSSRIDKVEVKAEAPVIDTADSRLQQTVTDTAIHALPLRGRNFLDLTALAPGVTGVGGSTLSDPTNAPDNFANERTVDASANGRASEANLYVLDGISLNSNIGPGVVNLTPNPESVQEIAIQTNTFSAEQGNASSIVVAMTSKAGTNKYHGAGSWFYTDQHLWSRSEFTSNYEPFHKNDMSAAVGGPIIKDRTFFFGSIESLRSSVSSSSQVHTYESEEFVNWAKQQFPDSLGTQLLSTYPVTNAVMTGVALTAQDVFGSDCGTPATFGIPCTLAMVNTGTYKPSPFHNGLQYSGRVDHYFNQNRDRIYGNFYRTSVENENPAIRPSFQTIGTLTSTRLQFNETHTFSSNFLNEATFAWGRVDGWSGKTGTYHVPEISVVGQDTGLGPGWGPGLYIQHNYNWRDVVTLVRGSHSLKIGLEVWHGDDDARFAPVNSRPSFGFNNLLDLVRDDVYSEGGVAFDPKTGSASKGSYRYLSTTEAVFIQDEWKAKPNLTLTLGVRWDDYGNPYPAQGTNLSNMLLSPGSVTNEKVAAASVLPVPHVFANRLNGNLSPRIGVAWDPTRTGRWTVRGGWGIYHDWPPLGRTENLLSGNPPGFTFPYFQVGTSSLPLFSVGKSDTYPFGFTYPTIPPLVFDSRGGVVGLPLSVGGFDRNYSAPVVYNWQAGVEHLLPGSLAVGAYYSGSYTANTTSGVASIMQPVASTWLGTDVNRFAGDLLDGTLDRLNSSFSSMNYSFGYNVLKYNAMVLTLRRRATSKGTFQASYTLSHVRDYGQDFPDWHNISQYEADANWDARHRFSLMAVYNLPLLSQSPALVRRTAGGWELASTVILQSGRPFTVFSSAPFQPIVDSTGTVIGLAPGSGDYNADGFNFDVPNMPNTAISGSHSRQDYLRGLFAAADFPVPAPGQEGNEQRSLFRGPGFANIDLGMIKNNSIGERLNLQVRFEFFNLFNRVNLQGVDSDLASGTFGSSVATYSPRSIQLGLRLEF